MSLSITHAYRNLYRAALQATLYSSPARYTIRKHIRAAFRTKTPEPLDQQRIARTLLFLRCAAQTKGLERRVVKNLVRVWGERDRATALHARSRVLKDNVAFQDKAWEEFEGCVKGLEKSLGIGFG